MGFGFDRSVRARIGVDVNDDDDRDGGTEVVGTGEKVKQGVAMERFDATEDVKEEYTLVDVDADTGVNDVAKVGVDVRSSALGCVETDVEGCIIAVPSISLVDNNDKRGTSVASTPCLISSYELGFVPELCLCHDIASTAIGDGSARPGRVGVGSDDDST